LLIIKIGQSFIDHDKKRAKEFVIKKLILNTFLFTIFLVSCATYPIRNISSTSSNSSLPNYRSTIETPPKAETEIIFKYNGPDGINVRLLYNGQFLGNITPGNSFRRSIPNAGIHTFSAQIGQESESLSLASRGSTTINVNITARRTPSGLALMDFSIINRTPSIIMYVNTDGLNVRNDANADAAWQDVMAQNTRVEILEEYTNSWTRIKYGNNKTGYVNGKYLTSTPPPLEITSLRVGNTDYNGRWLTNVGNILYSSQMRYLSPVITYNATFSGQVIFFIKIIQPNGELFRNPSTSPSGFTTNNNNRPYQITRGNNQTLYLSGWGSDSSSVYQSGEWIIEVWYNNRRLWSEKINIRP
jgi:hypothetical protein